MAFTRAEIQRRHQDKKRANCGLELIFCAICGKGYRRIGQHIRQRHAMTAKDYRLKYGYDVKRGLLPYDIRSEL